MEFIISETDKLLEAGVIKVVPHPTWVANPVVIYIEVLRQPSVSPERLKPSFSTTKGAGNPSTPTTRVASPEAHDPAMPTAEEALLPSGQEVLLVERTHPPWAQDIVKYMVEHALPEDDHEAERVARQAKLSEGYK